MIIYKLALVCFSLVFPKNLSPHKEYFFQYVEYSLMGSVWGKHGLSLFSGNLGHLRHCGVFVQPDVCYCIISEFVGGFCKICESESLLTFPHVP